MSSRAIVLKEVKKKLGNEMSLCLQQVIFTHPNGENDPPSFRFIRRGKDGKMKADRGQATFEKLGLVNTLVKEMDKIAIKF